MRLDISSKLWVSIIIVLLVGSIFNYWATLLLYERFYVEHQRIHLEELAVRIAEFYDGIQISDENRQQVKELNTLINETVVLAEDLSILGKCLPIESNNPTPFTEDQLEQMKNGEMITIVGAHSECNKDIIAVAKPLISNKGEFVGVIFAFTPLTTVNEAVSDVSFLLFIYVIVFLILGIHIVKIVTAKMTKPLRQMESVANKMMDGDFNAKVVIQSDDEIGSLGKTLNHLSDKLKQMIDLLSKEKSQLSQILDGISDSVLTLYKNENFVIGNGPSKNLFRKLGLTQEEFVHLPEIADLITKVSEGKKVIINEIEIKKHIFMLYLAPLTEDDELWGIVLVINNITDERKRVNEAREFLAIVSHELRTPIGYIKGYTEALTDGVAESSETQERYLQIIYNETKRMERLVNDLLDLAQLEKGTYPMRYEKLLLDDIVNQIVERYQSIFSNKGINLIYEKENGVPLWFIGDEDRVIQILVNLLDNAFRHTEINGIVTVKTAFEGEEVILMIMDTGIGIEQEYIERIGERFLRVDKARSRKSGGTGLGLAIVKQIIEKLDGRLEVESTVGKGTTFKIYFPLQK